MPEINITVDGLSYPIICAEGEEARVHELAQDLTARMQDIRAHAPHASNSHLLVLITMMLGSQIQDLQDEMAELRVQYTQAQAAPAEFQEQLNEMEIKIAEILTTCAQRIENFVLRQKQD